MSSSATVPVVPEQQPPVVIRAADPEQAAALTPCYDWLFAAPGALPSGWEPAQAARRLAATAASDRGTVLTALGPDGEVLGFCTAYLDLDSVRYGSRAWIEDLAVAPGHRSAGIGQQLLHAAMNWAAARDATHLELDSAMARTDAHRFYQRQQPDQTSLCFSWRLPARDQASVTLASGKHR